MDKHEILPNKIFTYKSMKDIPSKYIPKNIPFKLKNGESFSFLKKDEQITIKREEDGYIVCELDIKPHLEIQKNAITDEQTGVLNRYAYHIVLKNFLYSSVRSGLDIGILFVDIDDLKMINSEKGYLNGDRVIVGVAKVLTDTLRKSDLVVRLGGDEFLAIMTMKGGNNQLESIAKRIVKICESQKNLPTVSIGAKIIKSEEVKEMLDEKEWRNVWDEHVEYSNRYNRNAKELGKSRVEIG
jgi:diguanylate cyclase (GGDEF)-like protein